MASAADKSNADNERSSNCSTKANRCDLPLDALNFLLADVRGALGPYLNVFLVTQQHWSQSQVGLVTTIAGLIGLAAQTPAGAAIDATKAKRGAIILSIVILAIGSTIIFIWPNYWPVLIASVLMAIVGDVFGPAVSALTLGIYRRDQLASRIGRNSAFDHAGNIAIALLAGAVGYYMSQKAVFLLAPVGTIFTVFAVLSIPSTAIDHNRARGIENSQSSCEEQVAEKGLRPVSFLLHSRPLMIFSLCAMLFHFANAPLLPLVGQKLAYIHPKFASAMMSFCIIAAQVIMLPIALLIGQKADTWGRKPIFLIAFLVLPVRACLYTIFDNDLWLIAVQLLDGIGAGIFGALTPLVVADITENTPHFNLSLGAVATVQGIGASLSGLAAGIIVDKCGYNTTFISLAMAALAALLFFVLLMPETKRKHGIPISLTNSGSA